LPEKALKEVFMKQRTFLFAFILACVLALTVINVMPVKGGGGLCVTFHATANARGSYCGPTSGTFTVGANGTVEICGLEPGSYTFCTEYSELGYETLSNDQVYNVYVTAEAQCPCD
jgi:hypothetical protein